MTRKSFAITLCALVLAPALLLSADKTKQEIALNGQAGFEKARGDVVYRNEPDERVLKIDLDSVPLPTGTVLNVEINGLRVGTMKVGVLRGANLKLRSKDGDTIPFIANGTVITVRTEQRQAVVSGRF